MFFSKKTGFYFDLKFDLKKWDIHIAVESMIFDPLMCIIKQHFEDNPYIVQCLPGLRTLPE